MSRNISIRITGSGAIFAAACILILPLRWILAAWIAAAFHELCHLTALKICSVKIFSLEVGAFGAKIDTEPMPPVHQLVCAAAGPVGSFLLLLFARWTPLLSLLGLLQGLFNLLPVYPMDGGRILQSILEICVPGRGERIAEIFGKGVILFVIGYFWYAAWSNLGILLVMGLIIGTLGRKISCKDGSLGLQ